MSSSPQKSDTSELQKVSKLAFQNYQWGTAWKTAHHLEGYMTPFASAIRIIEFPASALLAQLFDVNS